MATTNNSSNYQVTQYNVLLGGANNLLSGLAPGTSGQLLQTAGAGTNPIWTTATFPSTAGTSGNVLTSNGTNWTSAPVTAGGGYLSASGTITSAQVKALHGTPQQLIAAPGAGKVIIVTQTVCKLNYGGTNTFSASSGQTIGCFYGTTQSVNGANAGGFMLSNTQIGSNSSQICINGFSPSNQATGPVAPAYSAITNTAINMYNNSSTEITGNAAGDNTLSWQIQYYILTI